MLELKEKRSLNSKHFDKDDGSCLMRSHVGHIHYFDKLDSSRLREIDNKLIWDDTKKGWTFKYHSFQPFFPEYSVGAAEFRDLFEDKDQTIKYKAIAENVKGVLIDIDTTNPDFDDNIDNKCVLYKEAFGENRDYLLYNTRSQMVKVATVNNPNDQTEDAIFEWEVEFPEKEIFRVEKHIDAEEMTEKGTKTNTEDGNLVGYKLDKARDKNFNTVKQTLIGDSKLDGKEWYTYLKSYKAWDSDGNTIQVEARLYNKDGKYILRKTIPLEFMKSAVGRVFTDTTTSYYVGAGDGYVQNTGTGFSWDVAHDATSGTADYTKAADWLGVRGINSSGGYFERGFFPTDTSGIGSGSTITAATFYFDLSSVSNGLNDGKDYFGIVETSQASAASLVNADFNQCGATDNPTKYGQKDFGSLTASAQNSITLTDTSIIDKTGTTMIGLREGHDIEDSPIGAALNNICVFFFSEQSGTDLDPYLEVTYSAGGGVTFVPKVMMF